MTTCDASKVVRLLTLQIAMFYEILQLLQTGPDDTGRKKREREYKKFGGDLLESKDWYMLCSQKNAFRTYKRAS